MKVYKTIYSHFIRYPVPYNINSIYSLVFLLGFIFLMQILTGLLLTLYYIPNINLAVTSIEYTIGDINMSLFFLFTFEGFSSTCLLSSTLAFIKNNPIVGVIIILNYLIYWKFFLNYSKRKNFQCVFVKYLLFFNIVAMIGFCYISYYILKILLLLILIIPIYEYICNIRSCFLIKHCTVLTYNIKGESSKKYLIANISSFCANTISDYLLLPSFGLAEELIYFFFDTMNLPLVYSINFFFFGEPDAKYLRIKCFKVFYYRLIISFGSVLLLFLTRFILLKKYFNFYKRFNFSVVKNRKDLPMEVKDAYNLHTITNASTFFACYKNYTVFYGTIKRFSKGKTKLIPHFVCAHDNGYEYISVSHSKHMEYFASCMFVGSSPIRSSLLFGQIRLPQNWYATAYTANKLNRPALINLRANQLKRVNKIKMDRMVELFLQQVKKHNK